MKERDLRIDLIKLIATAMVVVLHTVENGGYIQQYVYLLGTFGIPLFFATNGYLLYERDLTGSYFVKKTMQYLRFILMWSIVIGFAESVVERRFAVLDVLFGAMIGAGRLYHLWFITALLLIMAILCIVNYLLKRLNLTIQKLAGWKLVAVVVILMSISFFVDGRLIFTGRMAIRDIIRAPFRLITNGGYFLIGMSLHRIIKEKRNIKPIYLLCLLILCYTGICVLSSFSLWSWASSFYPCILCVVSTVAIMLLCLSLHKSNSLFFKTIKYIAPTSIGIWVLHPFALAVLRKLLELADIEFTLVLRMIMVPVVFIGCMIITKVSLRIKGVKTLFKI